MFHRTERPLPVALVVLVTLVTLAVLAVLGGGGVVLVGGAAGAGSAGSPENGNPGLVAGVRAGPDDPGSGDPGPDDPGPDDPGPDCAAQPDPPRGTGGGFGWPLSGTPLVVRAFVAPAHQFGPGHRGVDLATEDGAPVFAAGSGIVVFAGPVAGRPVLSVDHDGGLRTTYEPVIPSVSAGERVVRGQQIGIVQAGHPGCVVAACLHWGLRRGTDYLDPLRLLTLGRVRLLPWQGAAAEVAIEIGAGCRPGGG